MFGADTLRASQIWAAMVATLSFLVTFRTNKAYQRFWDGTTLLNQMWGEWFDAASCLFAFSHLSRTTKVAEVRNFRHTLIRLMSLCHGSALDEISQTADEPTGYPCLDLRGLDLTTLQWLMNCKFDPTLGFNRVEVIIHMIQTLIVESQDNGVLKIPPPILSRVFQTISRGQVNLANCKKITYTLFPFPYAQLITWMLIIFAVATPMVMASLLEHPHWAFIFTIIPVFGLTALNLVACELEIPFGTDDNDLPLLDFQDHMNNSMLMLIRTESDICPHITERAAPDMEAIKDGISCLRPKDVVDEIHGRNSFKEEVVVKEFKQPEKDDRMQEAKAPTPQSAPAQPSASNAPAPGPPVSAQEIVLQNKLEALSSTFDEVMAKMGVFGSRLGQTSDAMATMEFSRETHSIRTKSTGTEGSSSLPSGPSPREGKASPREVFPICQGTITGKSQL